MPTRSCPAVVALAPLCLACAAASPAAAEVADVNIHRTTFTNPRIIPHAGSDDVYEDVFDSTSGAPGEYGASGSATASFAGMTSFADVTQFSTVGSGIFNARGSIYAVASHSVNTGIIENQTISFAQYTFDVLTNTPFSMRARVEAYHTVAQADVLARVALMDDASGLFMFSIEARTDRPIDSIHAEALLTPGRYRLLAFAADQLFVDGAHPDGQQFSASYEVAVSVPASTAAVSGALPLLALAARRRRPNN